MQVLSRIIPLILLLIVTPTLQQLQSNELIHSQLTDCLATTIKSFVQTERDSHTRQSMAISFGACPVNPQIARALESAIQKDDFAVRKQAWISYKSHLDQDSKKFLILQFYRKNLDDTELSLVYLYLQQLVTPADKTRTLVFWKRGLVHPLQSIRFAAWSGLAKIGASGTLVLLKQVLLSADPDVLLAGLTAITHVKRQGRYNLIKPHLLHPDSIIQHKAIEVMSTLPGQLAVESLLQLNINGPQPENQAYLYNKIRFILKRNHIRRFGWTKEQAVLYKKPTHRAMQVAVLQEFTILYIVNQSNQLYRLQSMPRTQGRFVLIRTSSGLQGWIHESLIVKSPAIN